MVTRWKMPLWQVRAFVIRDDKRSDEYIDGKKIPSRVISSGYMCVHGQNVADTRFRAERIIRETYPDVLEVDFLNTKRIAEGRYFSSGFEGLESVN